VPGLADNLARVRDRIARAAARAGRRADEVTLVAVTKGCGPETVRDLHALGLRDFGENRVQDGLPKMDLPLAGARWHLIGPLQENKINKVLRRVVLIQSVDSLRIARAIADRAERDGLSVGVLLEVKTSQAPQKHGVSPEAARDAYAALLEMQGLEPRGLMTLADEAGTERELRHSFGTLRALQQAIGDPSCSILSMGMSDDFEIAIEEGATMVRIGRALVQV
jgi:pyridoxal phosphate enzyme (YggS family)